jgi:deoxyribonuclease-4
MPLGQRKPGANQRPLQTFRAARRVTEQEDSFPHRDPLERLGAHISTQGGVHLAPGRGTAIGATVVQLFTKGPSQWREPVLTRSAVRDFHHNLESSEIKTAISHDSYLINLASPDPELSRRSVRAFVAELKRCRALGISSLVSHPGNYIDHAGAGLERNARNYTRCLRAVSGVSLLIEGTAGSGTALGSRFEELAELRERIGEDVRERIGFCLDTCHLYSAGYDLRGDYEGVWAQWDRVVGLGLLGCLHLNDSKTIFDSRCDRHQLIGEGSLGPEPFRRIMRDSRFRDIPKIIETPKGKDMTNDRKMLRRLRRYARELGS